MTSLSIPAASFQRPWRSGTGPNTATTGKFASSPPAEKAAKGLRLRPGEQSCHGSLRLTPTPGFFERFVSELAPDGIVATVITGLVALMLVVVESLSYAALIFSGPLSPYIDLGIAITLNTAVVVGLMTAVFGSYPGTIAFSQNKIAHRGASLSLLSRPGASPQIYRSWRCSASLQTSTVSGKRRLVSKVMSSISRPAVKDWAEAYRALDNYTAMRLRR